MNSKDFSSFPKGKDGQCSLCDSKIITLHDKICDLFACSGCAVHLVSSHFILDCAKKIGINHPKKDNYESES